MMEDDMLDMNLNLKQGLVFCCHVPIGSFFSFFIIPTCLSLFPLHPTQLIINNS
jgi:hypothetical protein